MASLGLLYDSEDAVYWVEYLVGLLPKQSSLLAVHTCDLRRTYSKLPEIVWKSTVIVLLLTPAMLDLLETEASKYDPHLRGNVVVIMCYTKSEDYSGRLNSLYVNCNTWNALSIGDTVEYDQEIMLQLLDIVDQYELKSQPTQKLRKQKCNVLPKVVTKAGQSVAIMFDHEICGSIQVGFSDDDQRYKTKKTNPYTCLFHAPFHEFGVTKLQIFANDKKLADIPFVFKPPLLAAFQCPVFLAQSLGVSPEDKEALDSSLVHYFENTFPGDDFSDDVFKSTNKDIDDNLTALLLPTTLHFAAYNGLTKLCMILTKTPCANRAFQIENCNGDDPADLAENTGNLELAELLRLFFDTQAIIDAYDSIYMEMKKSDGESYCNQEQLSCVSDNEIYDEIPEYSQQQNAQTNEVFYEDMTFYTREQKAQKNEDQANSKGNEPQDMRHPESVPAKVFMGMVTGRPISQLSKSAGNSRTQQELIDLINSFKDGTFSLDDVEKLFSNWKHHNTRASASIKDRQKNIHDLREKHFVLFNEVQSKSKNQNLKKLKQKKKQSTTVTKHKPVQNPYTQFPHNLVEIDNTRSSATSKTFSHSSSTESFSDNTRSRATSKTCSHSSSTGSLSDNTRSRATSKTYSQSSSTGSFGNTGFDMSDSSEEEDEIQQLTSKTQASLTTNRKSLRFVLKEDLENVSPPQLPPRPPPRNMPLPERVRRGSLPATNVPRRQ